MYELNSCIAAIATAPGQGGIGIIRLSAPVAPITGDTPGKIPGKTPRHTAAGVLDILSKVFKARYHRDSGQQSLNHGIACQQYHLFGKAAPLPDAQSKDSSSSLESTEAQLSATLNLKPWVLHRGWVLDENNQELDDALAVFMPGPRTFTGEDCAEIHCHGGRVLLEAVLQSVLHAGARYAGPGEFSYRAFINGRMDLSQAEAVGELIAASSKQGIRLAKAKLDGALGQKINSLKDKLLLLQAQLCLLLDFSLELSGADTDNVQQDELRAGFLEVLQELRSLSKAYQRARAWREGALVVLAGPVNAGKSSLMNAILGRKRSLVGPTPGTTRDYIEENIDLDGLPVRLVDTAGLRETSDSVEAEGVSLSRELYAQADFIILMRDCALPGTPEEDQLQAAYPNSLLVLNKVDLCSDLGGTDSPKTSQSKFEADSSENNQPLYISAQSGRGVDELLQTVRCRLLSRFGDPAQTQESDLAPNLRQTQLIQAAEDEIENLLYDLDNALPPEILSVRLDMAVSHLQDIVGVSGIDDVMQKIFTNFCIGK